MPEVVFRGSIGYSFPLYRNLHIELRSGYLYCVLGPNGSGKSTLLKTLSGSIPVFEGSLEKIPPDSASSYLPPDPPELPGMRGGDAALSFLATNEKRLLYGNWHSEQSLERLARYIEEFSSPVDLERNFNELSTGERMKILLASALASEADFLFLDEPSGHLDVRSRILLYRILKREKGSRLIVLSMHELSEASSACDKGILLGAGNFYGPSDIGSILNEDLLSLAYGARFKKVLIDGKPLLVPYDIL